MGGVKLIVGNAVLLHDTFFAAGVWDGEADKGDLLHASFVCCTGAVFKENEMIFVTPIHMQDTIFSIQTDSDLYFSNSSAFCLAASYSKLDVDYYNYEYDFCSSLFGYGKDVPGTPLAGGREMRFYRCAHIKVTADAQVTVERKYSGLRFKNYQDYERQFHQAMERLVQNATSKLRPVPYGQISTVSKGYDAPACCVLAKHVGCDEVLTFNRPKKYLPDLGTKIAQTLDYHFIYELDADIYKRSENYVEAGAFCSGESGTMISHGALSEYISDKLLYMGIRGDSIWNRNSKNVNNDFDFSASANFVDVDISFNEYGLEFNSVLIMPPLFGADNWKSIHELALLEDMLPYTLHNDYDRPIPRRMAEEAGVKREEFGQYKRGAGFSYHYDTLSTMKTKMSPKSYASLLSFSKQLKRKKWNQLKFNMAFYYHTFPVYLNYILSRLHIGLRIKKKENHFSSPLSSLLILWGMNKQMEKYKLQ